MGSSPVHSVVFFFCTIRAFFVTLVHCYLIQVSSDSSELALYLKKCTSGTGGDQSLPPHSFLLVLATLSAMSFLFPAQPEGLCCVSNIQVSYLVLLPDWVPWSYSVRNGLLWNRGNPNKQADQQQVLPFRENRTLNVIVGIVCLPVTRA